MTRNIFQKPATLLIFGLAMLVSACGPGQAEATATPVDVQAIYTAAAQTLEAKMTMTAFSQPTATQPPTATLPLTEIPATLATIAPPIVPTATLYFPQVVYTPLATSTFSLTPSSTPTQIAFGCYNASLVADVTIPPGTYVAPGDDFKKVWKIRNNGTCEWTPEFKFTYVGGEIMGSDTFKIRRTVAPGGDTEITVIFTAPDYPGTFTGYWRMATDTGNVFGVNFVVSVKIAGATATASRTPTTIPSATKTLTPPPTAIVPTNTTAPSATSIPPTDTPPAPTDTSVPPTETPTP